MGTSCLQPQDDSLHRTFSQSYYGRGKSRNRRESWQRGITIGTDSLAGEKSLWESSSHRRFPKKLAFDNTAVTEYTEWVGPEIFPKTIAPFAGDKEESAKAARRHTDGPSKLSFWKDGSRLDSRHTRAGIVWCDHKWKMRKTSLSTNKELLDAELYAIGEVLGVALQGERTERGISRQQTEPPWTRIHIWKNSQAAIKRLQYTDPGPRQWLARRIIRRTHGLTERGVTVEIHWVLGQIGVKGNKRTNGVAKEVVEKAGTQRCPERFAALAHVGHTISERKWKKGQSLVPDRERHAPPNCREHGTTQL